MFLRDCKIISVSIIKTNVAAVKKKIKDGEKISKKNILVPVFITLDSLGGRSLAHVLWSVGSDSCKRLCYPGACCCWRTRFVFSHTGRWYTVSFHLVLLFIRRPIFVSTGTRIYLTIRNSQGWPYPRGMSEITCCIAD